MGSDAIVHPPVCICYVFVEIMALVLIYPPQLLCVPSTVILQDSEA